MIGMILAIIISASDSSYSIETKNKQECEHLDEEYKRECVSTIRAGRVYKNTIAKRDTKKDESGFYSLKFNRLDIFSESPPKSFSGEFFIENGFQKWTITDNGMTSVYSSFAFDKAKYKGEECTHYELYTKEKEVSLATQLYICNNSTYLIFRNNTLKYYNK